MLRSPLSNLRLADSWLALGAVHKNMYGCSQQVKGIAQCWYFSDMVIQMRMSALFVAKTNFKFFKIYIVSTSNMAGWGEERGKLFSQCLPVHFFGQGEVNFSW